VAKRFLVIGLGRFGMSLAETLAGRGYEVVAIDRRMVNIDKVKDRVAYAVELDSTDPAALRSIDAARCEAAIVAIGEGFEAAVLTIAALKECAVPRIIARARTDREARILSAVGATQVIEIEIAMGRQFGASL
jgi:trk system potassium uptake protein